MANEEVEKMIELLTRTKNLKDDGSPEAKDEVNDIATKLYEIIKDILLNDK